ncbi:DUF3857 domain-containing protein [Dysgonomonas sp. BGC7]|uniref:DUF3857 domain-containing protein n=1 Tax=Dysgonomonas sp. BGC7 TaxID=1658008 RepID=UPI0006822829|nr:DUF3857 domain-containing protein [Dysgonomonas sp. BGC7]MBD8388593.1 DUF3857 domain-containing protein [Dysgonomonas sp. BGC7]
MKNTLTFLFFFIFASVLINAQEKYTQDEGQVTQYEMSMTEYDKDKDAEAVVLYDLGDYRFIGDENRGFLLRMKKRTKIKILKPAGLDYANFEIPYYIENRDWESIQELEAIIYNYEGGQLIKTTLDKKNIFEEKVSDKLYVKKIALPNVKEGSVIELNYTILTPFYFYMRPWSFQRKIPVVYSKLNYRAIPYYEYVYILKGSDKLDEFKSSAMTEDLRFGNLVYREMIYTFGMKNLPAFRDEEYITSNEDYMIGINFQLSKLYYPRGGSKDIMTTWTAMNESFLKNDNLGKYIKKSEKEAKKILPELNITATSQLDQAKRIVEYVKHNYNWNGRYGKFAELSLSDFLKRKTGNVANINLFLTGMLNAAGIDAYPVALSTRENGFIRKEYPFSQFLNYVLVQAKIDGKIYNIDATEPLLYFSDVPERCINVEGLVVKPKTEEWSVIYQKGMSLDLKSFTINLIPEENKMEVDASFAATGFRAYSYRSTYLGKSENLLKYLKDNHNITPKNDIKIGGEVSELNKPFQFLFTFDSPVESSSDRLFIHPFCNLSPTDNIFKQTSRSLHVDMVYSRSLGYKSVINIPKGYKVDHMPEPFSYNDALMKVDYILYQDADKVIISANSIFKKNIYQPSEYETLKRTYAKMIEQFSEMLVLSKIY